MATCAAIGKYRSAVLQHALIFCEKSFAAGRVFQEMRRCALQEEERHVRRLLLGRFPVGRILVRNRNFNWRDGLAANERTEMQQPLFTEESDVQVDAIQCAKNADRI